MSRKLISSSEAKEGKKQHTRPCSDCPMARDALPGWLGGATPEEYRNLAHSDHQVKCHAISNMECAGMGIYRTNVCKRADFRLPANTELVFSTPMEFMEHHTKWEKLNKGA